MSYDQLFPPLASLEELRALADQLIPVVRTALVEYRDYLSDADVAEINDDLDALITACAGDDRSKLRAAYVRLVDAPHRIADGGAASGP